MGIVNTLRHILKKPQCYDCDGYGFIDAGELRSDDCGIDSERYYFKLDENKEFDWIWATCPTCEGFGHYKEEENE